MSSRHTMLDSVRSNPALGELLLQTVPLGISIVDAEGRLLFANQRVQELLGEATLGQTCWSAYRDDRTQCADCPLLDPIEVGVTKTFDAHTVRGGRIFRISHTGMLLDGQKVLLEVFRDITEVTQAQEQIHQLERERALEAERSRIARDMHDQLGATITHLKMLGEMLELDADKPELVVRNGRFVAQKARQLADEIDEVVWATNPRKDYLENLASYLCSYAEEFLRVKDLRCRMDVPSQLPELPLPAHARYRVFLAVKEALNNAVKHAAAREVWLSLAVQERSLRIEVRDDGRGFAADAVAADCNGLQNMVAGLAEIGGACAVTSSPGNGTCVRLTVPLAPVVPPANELTPQVT